MTARPLSLTVSTPPPTETQLHEATAELLGRVLLPPAVWTTINVGHIALSPAQAGKLYRLGVQRGWPDLVVLHGGRLHGIELKVGSGRLSRTRAVKTRRTGRLRVVEGQEEVHPRLLAAGMLIETCRSLDDVLATLAQWTIPTRGIS